MMSLTMKKVYNPTIEHQHHPIKFIKGVFGPHKGKIVCILCNKFVKWANKDEVKYMNAKSQEIQNKSITPKKFRYDFRY